MTITPYLLNFLTRANISISNNKDIIVGFLGGTVVKNLPLNTGDAGSIPGSGRYPEGGNSNPLQYSCLENPRAPLSMGATVHGVAKRHD